ncbi:MAG TPA: quinolinate synthase NadA [Thermoanaerobaculia bacterium]|nr:quinolinate synthase NadA [Thermoanaerobaculia bacterium]
MELTPFSPPPPHRDLAFTPEVERSTRDIYARLRHVVPEIEWPVHAPLIAAINRLKRDRDAIILAHNYQTPEIFSGVADITGDSLALAREAQRAEASVIVLCGVHFMAETAKLLNPSKTVLLPDLEAGCSLAASITAADVRALRALHPGVPVVTYVNTSAAVKAESDVCCTSANVLEIVEALPGDRVIFLPDEYLARWVAGQTTKQVILWQGHCEVHERFTGPEIHAYREQYPGLVVLAHPECPPDVLDEADFVGSTSKMSRYVDQRKPPRVLMVTECSMSDNVAVDHPELELIRPCNLCPHMKRITLPKILRSLETMTHAIEIEPEVARRAARAVERMMELSTGSAGLRGALPHLDRATGTQAAAGG